MAAKGFPILVGHAGRESTHTGQFLAADQLVLRGAQLSRGALELGQARFEGRAVGAQIARHAVEANGQTSDFGRASHGRRRAQGTTQGAARQALRGAR
ncbi:MAG: hypothetical protein QM778_13110 [Myxococcales bacterium]